MSPDTRFEVADDVLHQQVGEEIVLLDLKSESYFGLNPVGARVWQLLQEGAGQSALVETISGEFKAKPSQVERDVADLLERLVEAGLLRRVEAG